MSLSVQQREFLSKHRLCVVAVDRRAGPPHVTPVYYALDGDEIIISTTATRYKAKAIARHPEISLCVLAEEPPFPYLLVYGKGEIERAGAVDAMMRIGERMTGNPIPESARPALEERAKQEGRVVLRVRPERALGNAS